MLRKATLFMKLAVLFIGAISLLFAVMLFPEITKNLGIISDAGYEHISPLFAVSDVVFLVCLCAAAIPFFLGLYQAYRILGFIDKKQVFSALSVKSFKFIGCCATAICGLYMLGAMPSIYCFAELGDAPGILVIGFVIGLLPILAAMIAYIAQKLIQEVADTKLISI